MSWMDILGHWRAIVLDLRDHGVDCFSELLKQRPWIWLEWQIVDLISQPDSRLHKALTAAPPPTEGA